MMRPDEQANQADIVRDQRMRKNISSGLGAAAGIASGAVGARVLPLLSSYVPVDLAMKGLSKINPKIADFLKRGQNAGLDIKQGMDYVKNMITPKEEVKTDSRNLIEKYSPELHQFISQQIKSGRSALEAGAIAQLSKKGGPDFKSVIDKITKDHKTTFADILEAVYGGTKSDNNAGNVAQNPSNMTGNAQPQGQNGQMGKTQQSQVGPGQQALMDILGKINQKLGQ